MSLLELGSDGEADDREECDGDGWVYFADVVGYNEHGEAEIGENRAPCPGCRSCKGARP